MNKPKGAQGSGGGKSGARAAPPPPRPRPGNGKHPAVLQKSPVCFTCMATCVLRASYVRTAGWRRSGHRHVGGDRRGLCLGWPDRAQGPGGWDSGQSPGGAQGGTGQLMTAVVEGPRCTHSLRRPLNRPGPRTDARRAAGAPRRHRACARAAGMAPGCAGGSGTAGRCHRVGHVPALWQSGSLRSLAEGGCLVRVTARQVCGACAGDWAAVEGLLRRAGTREDGGSWAQAAAGSGEERTEEEQPDVPLLRFCRSPLRPSHPSGLQSRFKSKSPQCPDGPRRRPHHCAPANILRPGLGRASGKELHVTLS